MANKRISDRGLLLYYTSLEEIKKIDPCLLGKLIVQELEWMSGRAEEPTFEDVRCDIFHMHLKEQIVVRDLANNRPPKAEEPQVSTYTDTPPSQEAATYYSPVPDDEARDFPTEDDKEEWYATLIPDGYPNRKDKFNKEWSYYFTSRTEAAKEAEAYLAKNKIHISLM